MGAQVPQARGGVDAAREDEGVLGASEGYGVDAAGVAMRRGGAETARGLGGGDVPQEDGAVAAGGDEARVVGGYGEGEDLVPVGGVGLDEAACGDGGGWRVGGCGDVRGGGGRRGGGGGGRVVQADGAVRGAGEDVVAGGGGIADCVDGACRGQLVEVG